MDKILLCGNCIFCISREVGSADKTTRHNPRPSEYGCHRYPPKTSNVKGGALDSFWPPVSPRKLGCGEGKPRS